MCFAGGLRWSADSYETKIYHWCLTFEQPIQNKSRGKKIAASQHQKFRILLVSEETLALSIKKMPDEVFAGKTHRGFTEYCDRRWMHIRKMAELECMRRGMKVRRNKEDPRKLEIVQMEDDFPDLRRKSMRFANTFFVDKVEVVVPKNEVRKLKEHMQAIKPALGAHSNRQHIDRLSVKKEARRVSGAVRNSALQWRLASGFCDFQGPGVPTAA